MDTDGTLWFYWARTQADIHNSFFPYNTTFLGFPYGFDMSLIPYSNLMYDFVVFINKVFAKESGWSLIIFLSNFFTLGAYSLTAYFTYRFLFAIVRNAPAAYVGSIVFGFSFYFLRYSGGSLSLNQLWLIPLYFWSLHATIDNNYRTKDILRTAFANAIVFAVSPYWGGYNLFFTPIFILSSGHLSLNVRMRKWFIMTIHFIWVFVAINAGLFVNFFNVLDRSQANSIGYLSDYLVQAIDGVYNYFSPHSRSIIYSQSQNDGYFYLGTATIILYLLYFISKRRSRIIVVMNFCFLLSIIVSTRISLLQGFSESIYDHFLRYLRAISRINLYSLLFISVIIAESFKNLTQRYSKYSQISICLVLVLFILLENFSTEDNWLVRTNMAEVESIYSDIRKDSSVDLVISYPLYDNDKYPIPTTYQFIAQIIHGKTMINGFNASNPKHVNLMRSLNDLRPPVIDKWQELGVDRVIIYPDKIIDAKTIIGQLIKSPRVKLISNKNVKIDEHPSNPNLDTIMNVIVLKVDEKHPNEYSFLRQSKPIETVGQYKNISSSLYKVEFYNAAKNDLVLNYPFDSRWLLISLDKNTINNFIKGVEVVKSQRIRDGKANYWNIDVSDEKTYYLIWKPYLLTKPFDYLSLSMTFVFSVYFIITTIQNIIGNTNNNKGDNRL